MTADFPSTTIAAEVWHHIEKCAAAGKKVTVRELCDATRLADFTATAMLRSWMRKGLLRADGSTRDNGLQFVVVPPADRAPSLQRSAETNMWAAMRGLRTFTPTDIMAHANAGGVTVTIKRASSYCQLLLAGRYLRVKEKATKTSEATYRLVCNTGPLAPIERRVRAMTDPNTNETVVVENLKGGAK